ncbi:MAG: peptidyl-tRNA hydrolase, family [Clostridia bacterium]|nr:peptidyl-tRNA hydrolase, family [Clostridia bacterium]
MVVGLGNPGPRYEMTRHNAGFMVIDLLADELGISLNINKHQAIFGVGKVDDNQVILVKPQTFMNNSGIAVAALAHNYNIVPANILVINDDLDLAPGRLRIRPGGSAGGHRGLSSIFNCLGTKDVPRVKIGIGRPENGNDVIDYVLKPFSDKDWEVVKPILLKAVEAVRFILDGGSIKEAMNNFNN